MTQISTDTLKQLQDLWNLIWMIRREGQAFSGTFVVVLNTYSPG
jgi:hypothetical protein